MMILHFCTLHFIRFRSSPISVAVFYFLYLSFSMLLWTWLWWAMLIKLFQLLLTHGSNFVLFSDSWIASNSAPLTRYLTQNSVLVTYDSPTTAVSQECMNKNNSLLLNWNCYFKSLVCWYLFYIIPKMLNSYLGFLSAGVYCQVFCHWTTPYTYLSIEW